MVCIHLFIYTVALYLEKELFSFIYYSFRKHFIGKIMFLFVNYKAV